MGPLPLPPASIRLVEQGSWLDFIQRKGSIALNKFKNHGHRNQEKEPLKCVYAWGRGFTEPSLFTSVIP